MYYFVQLKQAIDLYVAEIGKPFLYLHCWELLRNDPKWEATVGQKRRRTNTDGSSCANEMNFGGNSESSANQDRPLGRKASKDLAKNKGKADSSDTMFTQEFWEEKKKIEHDKAERHERTLQQHQEQLDLQRLYYEMSVIGKDTTGMN